MQAPLLADLETRSLAWPSLVAVAELAAAEIAVRTLRTMSAREALQRAQLLGGAAGLAAGAALFDHVMRSRERMHRVRGAGAATPASSPRTRSKR